MIDERKEWANRERFPNAEIYNLPFEKFLENWQPKPNHYLILVTKGHSFDSEILKRVLTGQQRYLGVIGSKSKAHKLKKELLKEGFTEEDWKRVHCPIGIPIGGDNPEEIAVSIVAQLIQVRYSEREKPKRDK